MVRGDVDYLNINVEFKKNLNNHNEFSMPLKLNNLRNQSDLGHFNSSYSRDEIKNYLNIITKFEMIYKFKIYFIKYYKENQGYYVWRIKQIYNFNKNAHFVNSLIIDNHQWEGKIKYFLWMGGQFSHVGIEWSPNSFFISIWETLEEWALVPSFWKNFSDK